MYIRISRCSVPDIFDEHYHFSIDKAVVVEEGNDISLFTNGETLAEALIAAEELKNEGISVEVINVPVVKPLDIQTVVNSIKKTKFAVTVENHSIIGGLGSAICEALSSRYPAKIFRIGVHDEFGQSGKSDELLEYYGLDAKTLVKRIRTLYKQEQG
jgi:transketolase